MNIKSITIDGAKGEVEIARTDAGALVTAGSLVICEVGRGEDREARYVKACMVAAAVYGTDRRGRPAATNSMVHGLLDEIDRVAGC